MLTVVLGCAVQAAIDARLPDASLNLTITAPITTWDEAIPLGNGAMGVLLWGENNMIRLSLDRGDLWDERPSKSHLAVKDRFNWASMQRMVAENNMKEFNAVFDSNYDYNGPPTKLPAGRLEIELANSTRVESFQLSLAAAEGLARFANGEALRVFVNAGNVTGPVAVARIPGRARSERGLRQIAEIACQMVGAVLGKVVD
ncbi:MAG: glycoside hydrolase N-terminal domain-containing protein, partial [Verrucomicrobiota bacterium]|nr:glycoside hydrolase N-terminal domain-containing protein [Verrucomicrobiota bacterium]